MNKARMKKTPLGRLARQSWGRNMNPWLTPGRRRHVGPWKAHPCCRCRPGGAPQCAATARCRRPPWPAPRVQPRSPAPSLRCPGTACWRRCCGGWAATGWRHLPAAPARPWRPAGEAWQQRGAQGGMSWSAERGDRRGSSGATPKQVRIDACAAAFQATPSSKESSAHLAAEPGGAHEAPAAQQRQHEAQAAHHGPGHPAAAAGRVGGAAQ